MKKLVLAIGLALAVGVINLAAQETNSTPWYKDWIKFNTGVSNARQLTLAAYPGWAPGLTVNGEKKEWGAGMALLYPISANAFVGGRVDWLADRFWAPSATIGLQTDVLLFNKLTVTPFTIGGGIVPVGGSGEGNGELGAIVGAGIYSTVWHWRDSAGKDKGGLSLFYAAEYWTVFDGVLIHRPGAAFTFKF